MKGWGVLGGGTERKGIRMKSSHGSCRDVLPIMRCSESERAVTKAQSNRLLPNSPFAGIGNAECNFNFGKSSSELSTLV